MTRLSLPLFCAGVLVLLGSAGGAAAQERLRVEGVAARLRILPEGRDDVAATVTAAGAPTLPPVRIHREGDEVIIDQGPAPGPASCVRTGTQTRVLPPQGGAVALADLPLITVHLPLRARIELGSAVFATIGASDSLELTASGCSEVTLGAVTGPLELRLSGAAEVAGAAAGDTRIETRGSGGIVLGRVRGLDVRLAGSGPVTVAAVSGPLGARLSGAGGLRVGGGRAPQVTLEDAGSGDISFGGLADGGAVTVTGSGSVTVARTLKPLVQTVTGSGRVRIGG